jgi:hypothetical protein
MVFTNDVEEQVSFTVKNFAPKGVAIIFWCSACEAPLCFSMQSSYIISGISTKSFTLKIFCQEKMQVTLILTEFVDSMKPPPRRIQKKYYA